MIKLMDIDSDTYRRRLVRVMNDTARNHGLYSDGMKLTGAHIQHGVILAHTTRGTDIVIDFDCRINNYRLIDGYGRTVCASRETR